MSAKRYRVDGRVVLITGGARGIGADAAARLAARGAQVALVDLEGPELEQRVRDLGPRAAAFAADVTDPVALQAAVDGTLDRFGAIDVVIANAGISGPPATVATIAPADFERVIDVNLLGVWRTVRATLPHVVERRGYILPIASIAAAVPAPLVAAYSASKHGVEGFARSLRMELAATGTRVGIGYFSFIDTDMVRNAFASPAAAHGLAGLPAVLRRPIPVAKAGEAVVRGVERRADRVYAPGWVPALLALRGFGGPVETLVARRRELAEACDLPYAGEAVSAPTRG
jgi:NAD(P)-dependent dehydrogenase (short-subunit alcohol dehydrogenase family)